MPLVAYSDEEEGEGGFTLTGEEAMSGSLPSAASTSGLPAMDMPCTLQGLTSGASGGALGYVFGFGTFTRSMQELASLGVDPFVSELQVVH